MDDTDRVDTLFRVARQHESALQLALRVGDELGGLVSAARLLRALDLARAAVDEVSVRSAIRGAALRAMLDASTRDMVEALGSVRTGPYSRDRPRLLRWIAARAAMTPDRRNGPHVFELDCRGVDLRGAELYGLHIARSRFIADLRRATIRDSIIELSDLTYSDLENTIWQNTTVERSFLRDSSLIDATLDRVAFIDCDLQGARLGLSGTRLVTRNHVQFLRCDLRGVQWGRWDLLGVELLDCRLQSCTFAERVPANAPCHPSCVKVTGPQRWPELP